MSNKINSIFYFPESLTFENYLSQLNSGSIAERTIVFAEAQLAIYKNGVLYGIADVEKLIELIKEVLKDPSIIREIEKIFKDSDDPDLINKIKAIIAEYLGDDNNAIIFPVASKTQRGVVKIGTGLQMGEGNNFDTVNVDFTGVQGIPGLDGLVKTIITTEPAGRASKSQYGVVKVGDGINVSNGVISVSAENIPGINNVGGEPSEYIKRASASGNTLTLTKKDGSTVTFTPSGDGTGSGEPSAYLKSASVSSDGKTLTITPKSGGNITFSPSGSGNGSSTLAGLSDVQIDGPTNNQSLVYNSSLGKWVNGTVGGYTPTPGEGGTTYVENDYDDTWIRSRFASLEGDIDNVEDSIRSDLQALDNNVVNKFKNAFPTYKSLIDYYTSTGDNTYTNYTFGDDDLDVWASRMGLITPNGNGTYTVGWSDLTQSYNSLRADVTQIQGQLGSGGNNINYEMLASGLYAYIEDNYATSGMESTWGKFMVLDDDDIRRLEWMSSGVQSYASDSLSFAKLMAAALEYDEEGKELLLEAWSGVNALVEKDYYGNYVATSYLSSLVDDSISGIFTQNSSNSAVADLYSRIRDVETQSSYVSGLRTEVTKLQNGDYMTSAILASKIGGMTTSDKATAFAGLATQASLTSAQTALTTELNGVKSSISNVVKHDGNNKITSEIILDADQILINGDTFVRNLTANSAFIAALQTVDLGASHSLICGTTGDFGISITASDGHANLRGGLIEERLSGEKYVPDASLKIWYGTYGAQMLFSDISDYLTAGYGACSTLFSGDGIWIMPECHDHISAPTSNAYLTITPVGIRFKEVSDDNDNSYGYVAHGFVSGFSQADIHFSSENYQSMLADDHLSIYKGYSLTTNHVTVFPDSVTVTNDSTGAYTLIEAGKITISDGNGNTKEITATN